MTFFVNESQCVQTSFTEYTFRGRPESESALPPSVFIKKTVLVCPLPSVLSWQWRLPNMFEPRFLTTEVCVTTYIILCGSQALHANSCHHLVTPCTKYVRTPNQGPQSSLRVAQRLSTTPYRALWQACENSIRHVTWRPHPAERGRKRWRSRCRFVPANISLYGGWVRGGDLMVAREDGPQDTLTRVALAWK